jgi:hypothetical protein
LDKCFATSKKHRQQAGSHEGRDVAGARLLAAADLVVPLLPAGLTHAGSLFPEPTVHYASPESLKQKRLTVITDATTCSPS